MLAKMCSKENAHPLLVKLRTCTVAMRIRIEFPQKVGNRFNSALLDIYLKYTSFCYKGMCSTRELLLFSSFIIARNRKQPFDGVCLRGRASRLHHPGSVFRGGERGSNDVCSDSICCAILPRPSHFHMWAAQGISPEEVV